VDRSDTSAHINYVCNILGFVVNQFKDESVACSNQSSLAFGALIAAAGDEVLECAWCD
jgi:hypothetical protein